MRSVILRLLFSTAVVFSLSGPLNAETLCTLIVSAERGAIVHEAGDCDERVTPASTFKIPLALMGFDAGVLVGPNDPAIPFQSGYPDWGGAAWRQDTDPSHWMRHSVVWYSQFIARELGVEGLTRYGRAFAYGNADFSGDPGRDNALERSWISSSLKISPREQVAFLRTFLSQSLPASAAAHQMTAHIAESHALPDGTIVWGKTGSAYPRNADGGLDRARGWGWFVGWAAKGDDFYLFARLSQATGSHQPSGGNYTRETVLADWPELVP